LRQKYYKNHGIVYATLTDLYQNVLAEILIKVELRSVLLNLESLIGNFSLTEVKTTFQ
jgi:hypothetical protein